MANSQPTPGAAYTIGTGTTSLQGAASLLLDRAPTASDTKYPIGKIAVNTANGDAYILTELSSSSGVIQANWDLLGTQTGGPLNTLTGDTGGAISPSGSNITLAGTTGQIATSGAGSTITYSLSSTLVAPGSLEVTGLLKGDAGATLNTAGTAMNIATDTDTAAVNIATAGARTTTIGDVTGASALVLRSGSGGIGLTGATTIVGTTNINATGAAVTTIGTGGTGALALGNATGNTSITGTLTTSGALIVSAGGAAITGTTTINTTGSAVTTIGTGGTGAVAIGNATGNTAVTGSLTASTGLVATTGGITASAGGAAITGTTTINTTGAAVTSIGTGGTGATNIGNATGNTAVTGSLTTSTTLTATLGAITATNGNLVLGSAGNKLVIHATTAANDSVGLGTLNGSGTVTISTTACTVNSKIFCQIVTPSGAGSPGVLSVPAASIGAGSFVVNSSVVTDASTFFYLIIN